MNSAADDERDESLDKAVAALELAVRQLEDARKPRSATDGVCSIYARKVAVAITQAETALLWAREARYR